MFYDRWSRVRHFYSYLLTVYSCFFSYSLTLCHFSCELGQCLTFSQLSGKTAELIQLWNTVDKGLIQESSHNLTILIIL